MAEQDKPGDEVPKESPSAGDALCKDCSGRGKTPAGETCTSCKGTGRVTQGIGGG